MCSEACDVMTTPNTDTGTIPTTPSTSSSSLPSTVNDCSRSITAAETVCVVMVTIILLLNIITMIFCALNLVVMRQIKEALPKVSTMAKSPTRSTAFKLGSLTRNQSPAKALVKYTTVGQSSEDILENDQEEQNIQEPRNEQEIREAVCDMNN